MNGLVRHTLMGIALGVAVFTVVMAYAYAAAGPPSGQPVLNQARSGVALTKSDSTVLTPTRGVFIGDAAACNIAVVFDADGTTAVTLANVQPGLAYPFAIRKLMSTNTTCTAVIALY